MLTIKLGVASYASGLGMATYLNREAFTPETKLELTAAAYYGRELGPPTQMDELGLAVHREEISFSEALDTLVHVEIQALPAGADLDDPDEIEERLSARLADAASRAEFAETGGIRQSVGILRPDLSPALAKRLGIDPTIPLTEHETANLMAGLTTRGEKIEGKHYRGATLCLVEIFGIADKRLPTLAEIDHVLAGRRADGNPRQDFPKHKVIHAERRFRAAVGLPQQGEPTAAQRAHLAAGRLATGKHVDTKEYRAAATNEYKPVGFGDLCFSASKSLSTAWALEPDPAKREVLLGIHTRAVEATMAVAAPILGWARKGDGGQEGENASVAWVRFPHYTARPTMVMARRDAEGNEFSDHRYVPTLRADPGIHDHVAVLNHTLTNSGRLGSVDFDRTKGKVQVLTGIYRAYSAKFAREAGAAVHVGEKRDAQLTAVSQEKQDQFSKRSRDAEKAAREYAKDHGLDWDALSEDRRLALLREGAAVSRNPKIKESVPDTFAWRQEADDAGLTYQPVLYQQPIRRENTPERRHDLGYEISHPKVGELLKAESIVTGAEIDAVAAHSMITAGISDRPLDDIRAITRLMFDRGIKQGADAAVLVRDFVTQRGKRLAVVSSDVNIRTETELVDLARKAVTDRSLSLTPDAIDRAAEVYLRRRPDIDRNSDHWKAQLEWAHKLGEGGRLSMAYGAAGCGKTTVTGVLAEAWKAEGRAIYGTALPWTATREITSVEEPQNLASLAKLLHDVKKGRVTLDANSSIIVDEISMLGNRMMRELLHLSETTGAWLRMMGDPTQIRSPEAGDPLSLLEKVMPNAVPELVKSIRQKELHEREVVGLFRTDPAAALAMKIADGSARFVAGGSDATIAAGVRLRREMLTANAHNPRYSLAVMGLTNPEVAEISRAIRADRKQRGEIGPDLVTVNAIDRTGRHKMPLGVGDEVRIYRPQVRDGQKVVAVNGDVLTVKAADEKGMHVHNQKTGGDGYIPWRKLQETRGAPVNISYGSCLTVDAKQASTVSDGLLILSEGSSKARSNKVYSAITRAIGRVHVMVDESSVRNQIHKRALIGQSVMIEPDDIIRRVAQDISRKQIKENATDIFSAPSQPRRQSVEREGQGLGAYARTRVLEIAHNAREHIVQAVEQVRRVQYLAADLVQQRHERRLGQGRGQGQEMEL